jgi:hypothetical protein
VLGRKPGEVDGGGGAAEGGVREETPQGQVRGAREAPQPEATTERRSDLHPAVPRVASPQRLALQVALYLWLWFDQVPYEVSCPALEITRRG